MDQMSIEVTFFLSTFESNIGIEQDVLIRYLQDSLVFLQLMFCGKMMPWSKPI